MTPRVFEIAIRCFSDRAPNVIADTALLFSETPDNQDSVIEAGAQILASRLAKSIAILNSKARCGYGGVKNWKKSLEERLVPNDQVLLVPTTRFRTLNTKTEAQAFVQWSLRNNVRSAYVVASPFHQIRAFMTIISVLLKMDARVRLYSFPGTAQNWQQFVTHSQGKLQGTRAELIQTELERIRIYRSCGDIASDKEIIGYLNHRDSMV